MEYKRKTESSISSQQNVNEQSQKTNSNEKDDLSFQNNSKA